MIYSVKCCCISTGPEAQPQNPWTQAGLRLGSEGHSGDPSTGRQRQEALWAFLASQSRWIQELHVQWNGLTQNREWKIREDTQPHHAHIPVPAHVASLTAVWVSKLCFIKKKKNHLINKNLEQVLRWPRVLYCYHLYYLDMWNIFSTNNYKNQIWSTLKNDKDAHDLH